jgi:hypothetical protein
VPDDCTIIDRDGDCCIEYPCVYSRGRSTLTVDAALRDGLIFISEGKTKKTVKAHLTITVTRDVVCDVADGYEIGYDAGLYLRKYDPDPRWATSGLLSPKRALELGILRITSEVV